MATSAPTPSPSPAPSPAPAPARTRQADDTPQQSNNGADCVPAPAPTADISAALLALLRKINSEVPPSPPLDGRALTAVQNFQRISDDLATLADEPAGSFSTSGTRPL